MTKKGDKVRLDLLVVERGLLNNRQSAQAAIMDGGVLVDGQKIDKPGAQVGKDAHVTLTKDWQATKFVSRGGFKLEKALAEFNIDVHGRVCLDVGASTGGFTDCLLKHGAAHVYAIDVGYGQLDWQLRNDPRVTVKERTNARYLEPAELYSSATDMPRANLAVCDVSFISLTKLLPACLALLNTPKDVVALVKPQFEAGRSEVGKGGVVRSAESHIKVLSEICQFAANSGAVPRAITFSPIRGPAGNIEFLLHLSEEQPNLLAVSAEDIQQCVNQAHASI